MKRAALLRSHAHLLGLALLAALGFSLGQAACSPSSPQLGSQTNWLIQCDTSAECGESACLCGTCTLSCSADTCSALPGSVCVPQEDPGLVALCGGQAAPSPLCLPLCEDGACESGTVCVSGVCVPAASGGGEITLDAGTRFQTLVGFGAGIGFTEDLIAQHPAGEELYDVLFAESGLDALRIRNRYEGSNDADLLVLAGIVDAASVSLGRRPTLFLSEGSPPPALKANGARMCEGNMDTCTLAQTAEGTFDYPGFAGHWLSSLEAYAGAGVTFDFLGIQNHPNFVPPAQGGEACRFLPSEGTEVVMVDGAEVTAAFPGYLEAHAAVAAALTDLPDAPVLTAPDTTGVGTAGDYLAPLGDGAVGGLSVHLYGLDANAVDTAALEHVRDLSVERGIPVLQTELRVGLRETAIFLHHALTSASAAAYLQNDLIAKDDAEEAVALVRLTDDAYEILPLYEVFAHYARHTDPGWVRIEAQTTDPDVLASAWIAPDESALTVVLFNPTTALLEPQLTLPESLLPELTGSAVTRTVFDGLERSAALGPLPEDGVVRLPPGSMATVAFTTD